MTKLSKIRNNRWIIFAVFLFVVVVGINLLYVFTKSPVKDVVSRVKVESIVEKRHDGGINYETVELSKNGQRYELKHEYTNRSSQKLERGDVVNIKKVNNNYVLLDVDRTATLIIVSCIFLGLILLSLGTKHLVELLPALFILPFLLSGLFSYLSTKVSFILLFFAFILFVAFVSIYLVSENLKVTLLNVCAIAITLLIVVFINYALTKILKISDVYYNYVDVRNSFSYEEFWRLFNFSIIFLAFGGIINNSMSISKRFAKRIKENAPVENILQLIIREPQKNIVKRINNLFFIFLGFSMVPLVIASRESELIWNNLSVLENFVLFMSAVAASIISPIILASVTFIFLNFRKNQWKDTPMRLRINPTHNMK